MLILTVTFNSLMYNFTYTVAYSAEIRFVFLIERIVGAKKAPKCLWNVTFALMALNNGLVKSMVNLKKKKKKLSYHSLPFIFFVTLGPMTRIRRA